MNLFLRLIAPYLAVTFFWHGMANGWLAIFAYHAQILFWLHGTQYQLWRPITIKGLTMVLPTVLAGPALYYILPLIVHKQDFLSWLTAHNLSHNSLLTMLPYFGLMHPILEQLHWAKLRQRTIVAHPLFAGYHLLVLGSLLTIPWLIICFGILTVTSLLWQKVQKRGNGVAIPILSHIVADTGLIVSAWIQTF